MYFVSSIFQEREYDSFSWSGSIILYLEEVFSFCLCLEYEQIVLSCVFPILLFLICFKFLVLHKILFVKKRQ